MEGCRERSGGRYRKKDCLCKKMVEKMTKSGKIKKKSMDIQEQEEKKKG